MRFALTAVAIVAAFVSGTDATSSRPTSPIVQLGYGAYEGTKLRNGVDQFLGMRYAAPPLGDLRWREPEPPQKHSAIQHADTVCLQTSFIDVN